MTQGGGNKGRVVISISTPVVVLGILVALWATNNFDNILAGAGAPGLTHACIATNSVGDAVRCAAYKLENAGSTTTDTNTDSATTDTPVQTTDTSAADQTTDTTPITAQTTTPPATGGCQCAVADLPNQCDPNIATTNGVTCTFAENTFYEYYKATNGDPTHQATVNAWSPATTQYDTEDCSSGDGVVDCSQSNGSDVRFNASAVSAYTSDQAATYANSGKLGPNG